MVQRFRHGCVLAPLPFNFSFFFTEVLRVADKRFFADTAFVDNMVRLQREEKAEKRGTPRTGKARRAVGM